MTGKTAPSKPGACFVNDGHLITLENSRKRFPNWATIVNAHERNNAADTSHKPVVGGYADHDK